MVELWVVRQEQRLAESGLYVARSILKSEQERYRRLQRKPSLIRLDQFQSSAGNNA